MENNSIAVFYLCRYKDKSWHECAVSFVISYKKFEPGVKHKLYIIFKGFKRNSKLALARTIFSDLEYSAIQLNDSGFDIGSYYQASLVVNEEYICPLNSYSVILSENWLYKLFVNLLQKNVGLVGASGSFEKNDYFYTLKFPNPHIRTNAFLIKKDLFINFTSRFNFIVKNDALEYESGRNSLSNFVKKKKLIILVVGRNGMGYPENLWFDSRTFKSSEQENLLVSDNQTRFYSISSYPIKFFLGMRAWKKEIF
jgi:hypothetical protein